MFIPIPFGGGTVRLRDRTPPRLDSDPKPGRSVKSTLQRGWPGPCPYYLISGGHLPSRGVEALVTRVTGPRSLVKTRLEPAKPPCVPAKRRVCCS